MSEYRGKVTGFGYNASNVGGVCFSLERPGLVGVESMICRRPPDNFRKLIGQTVRSEEPSGPGRPWRLLCGDVQVGECWPDGVWLFTEVLERLGAEDRGSARTVITPFPVHGCEPEWLGPANVDLQQGHPVPLSENKPRGK